MEKVKTILLSKSVFEDNDVQAERLRSDLQKNNICLVNVMSSPGSGKTTLLVTLINALKEEYKIGVMEADIDSDKDAVTVAKLTGVPSIQLHTGGMCHLDAEMTKQGLNGLGQGFDLIFLENVGNLVCPAEYDTGANINMVILSVPEGNDKPLKYPLVFEKSDLAIISKTDAIPYFDFNVDECKEYIHARNPRSSVIALSAKTGDNMTELIQWFRERLSQR